MSEQDKKSNPQPLGGPSVLVVDQTQGSRQKQSFRATELQQEAPELHHKRSRALGVPTVGEELKDICQEANASTDPDNKEEKEQKEQKGQDVVSYDIQKQMLTKKLSSSHNKHDPPETIQFETITLAPVNVENKIELDTKASVTSGAVAGTVNPQLTPCATAKGSVTQPPELQPEESQPPATQKQDPVLVVVNEESIKDEIKELPTAGVEKKQSDWSYLEEEQAGGLPRETRASRVSRSVRTFFCCGVPYEAPSEDDVSVENYNAATSSRCYYSLDEKASVGPCRPATCLERPSGICISLPKKSSLSCNVRDQGPVSGITLVVRKRCSKPSVNIEMKEIHSDPNGELQASSDECYSENAGC